MGMVWGDISVPKSHYKGFDLELFCDLVNLDIGKNYAIKPESY
jgi:hypothetical protein